MHKIVLALVAALVLAAGPACSSTSSSSGTPSSGEGAQMVTWKCADKCGMTKKGPADRPPDC